MLISIIIPLYNNAKFLPRLFACLQNQTYDKFEAIFIDNGSTDNPEKYFKDCDSRFQLITTSQKGVGLARNIGLKNSKGNFICFIDSDDLVQENYLESLLKSALEEKADVVFSSFYIKDRSYTKKSTFKLPNKLNNKDEIRNLLIIQNINPITASNLPFAVWGKLFKREITNGVLFPEDIKIGEDFVFMMEVLKNANIVTYIDTPSYIYVQNPNSSLHTYKENYIIDQEKPQRYLKEELLSLGINNKQVNLNLCDYLHYKFCIRNSLYGKKFDEYLYFLQKLREIKLEKTEYKALTKKQRLLNFIFTKFPSKFSFKLLSILIDKI